MIDSPNYGPALLEVRDLRIGLPRTLGPLTIVDGLSFEIHPGRMLALIGESGCGKTTACRSLIGLLGPSAILSGSVRWRGKELLGLSEPEMRKHRGADIAMVFQDAARSLNPTIRVGDQIAEALRQHKGLDRRAARRHAVELLDRLCVPEPERRIAAYPHELSGGMRQRVMIAIAIAGDPKLLIADEATQALDSITQAETMRLLSDLQRELGMAIILVCHDLRLACTYADEVLVMYAGRAVERAPTQQLFRRARMRYTQALLEAIPRSDQSLRPFQAVCGQGASFCREMPGCAFEPRCKFALDICQQARPAPEWHGAGHWSACWNPSGSYGE